MKKVFFVWAVVVSFLTACNKNTDGDIKKSTGILTGFDASKCYCCWGWIISINNTVYKFDKKPASSSIDLENISYPATVNIEWRPSSTKNCSNWIDVIRISQ
ncbi:MAG: hypothetical protein JNK14_11065 [Chitinophagaceae bacterium]|nr:hypothetical protein [Chitinophagaceae bacterium]